MKNKQKSALTEVHGIEKPHGISTKATEIASRRKLPAVSELLHGIFSGDIAALSRAITLVESNDISKRIQAADLVTKCLERAGNSIRIGITGVPGVGKSTFIEALGKYLTGLGKKVAVLAVDPSSSVSHGSILGDKTRMEELVKDEKAYIRPSASGGSLGGVAAKTRESIMLCEAFGFNVIIVETVGVGQSETAVHGMVDFFLLLKIAGAGDELQGIKRGIMEMADAILINKADGDNIAKAKLAKTEFNRALHLFPPKSSGWTPTVGTCSALDKRGIDDVWTNIKQFEKLTKNNGYFLQHRKEQDRQWFLETINKEVQQHFYSNPMIEDFIAKQISRIEGGLVSPFSAAQEVLNCYFNNQKQ